MIITSNTAVSAVVEYLNDYFQLICIGQLLPRHPLLDGLPQPKSQSKRHNLSIEINGKVKLALLAHVISKHESRPVRFAHSSIGLVPSNWTLDQVLNSVSLTKKENEDDKLGLALRLLKAVDSYEDLDWFARVLKNPKHKLSVKDREFIIKEMDHHLGFIPHPQKKYLEQIILSTSIEEDD